MTQRQDAMNNAPLNLATRPDLVYLRRLWRRQARLSLKAPEQLRAPAGALRPTPATLVPPRPVAIVNWPALRTLDMGVDSITIAFSATVNQSLPVAPARRMRRYLLIQNNSGAPMYVAFGREATQFDLLIPTNGNYEPLRAPRGSINIFSLAGGPGVLVQD